MGDSCNRPWSKQLCVDHSRADLVISLATFVINENQCNQKIISKMQTIPQEVPYKMQSPQENRNFCPYMEALQNAKTRIIF